MNNLTFTVLRLKTKIDRLELRREELKMETITTELDLNKYIRQIEMYRSVCSHEFAQHVLGFTKSNLKGIRFDLYKCSICGEEDVVEEDISDLQEEV